MADVAISKGNLLKSQLQDRLVELKDEAISSFEEIRLRLEDSKEMNTTQASIDMIKNMINHSEPTSTKALSLRKAALTKSSDSVHQHQRNRKMIMHARSWASHTSA